MSKKIIPLWHDEIFNTIFNNEDNIDLLEELIAILFQRDINEIRGKAKLLSRNLYRVKRGDAKKEVDILVDVDGEKFNIEIEDCYDEATLKKDYSYACNIHSRQAKRGIKNYNTIKATNQLIVFIKGLHQGTVLSRYPFKNENSKEILSDSMRIYLLDVEQGMCYDKNTNKIIQICHALTAETEEEFKSAMKGVFSNMEKDKRLVESDLAISMDPDDYSMTFDLSHEELLRNTIEDRALKKGETIGLKKGESIGLKKGAARKQEEIARAMIKDKVDKNIIAKYTKLPLSKIMML